MRHPILSLMAFLAVAAMAVAEDATKPDRVDIREKAGTRVYIKTVPPGAAVKIDGAKRGISDCLVDVPEGVTKLLIEVELDGEHGDKREIVVQGGRVNRVEFVLGEATSFRENAGRTDGPPTPASEQQALYCDLANTSEHEALIADALAGRSIRGRAIWLRAGDDVLLDDEKSDSPTYCWRRDVQGRRMVLALNSRSIDLSPDPPPILEFRILVKMSKEPAVIGAARMNLSSTTFYWVDVADEELLKDAESESPEYGWRTKDGRRQILVFRDDFNVSDKHLRKATVGKDPFGTPCIQFELTEVGGMRMGGLTRKSGPDEATGAKRQLAIIIDGEVISAPNINEPIQGRGQISVPGASQGAKWDDAFVNDLVDRLNKSAAAAKPDPTTKDGLKTLVKDFFDHNSREIMFRETIEWGEPEHGDNEHAIRYKCKATIWGRNTMILERRFVFDDDGKYVRMEKLGDAAADETRPDPKTTDGLKALVEDFFRHNYRDITSRETIEWGEPEHGDNEHAIRYKYEAVIRGKDTVVQHKVFTFSKDGEFLRVEDVDNVRPPEAKDVSETDKHS